MPTASSSTETQPAPRGERVVHWHPSAVRRAVADVGILFRFRAGTVRRRGVARGLGALFVVLTLAAAIVPGLLPGAGGGGKAFELSLALPTIMAGFLVLVLLGAVASGGGRELIAREQAVPFPLSPTTDHLGALLLAPLNIAWLLQCWGLLGATSFALGPGKLWAAEIGMLLWVFVATAISQVVAWTAEAIRRRPHGIVVVRAVMVLVGGTAAWLQITHRFAELLDRVPTTWIYVAELNGFTWMWAGRMLVLLGMLVLAVVLGAVPTHLAARRTPRDESRIETGSYQPRAMARTMWGALVRVDRGSVWRAVPIRRGMAVLSVGPGVVAVAGGLGWDTMTVLPGLVASGGALLFGVNAWCLDGRGALMRESMPVSPSTTFLARAYVLAEILAGASLVTVVLAALRAGVPDSAELTALGCTLAVVTLQVVAAAMRWSSARPFPVDLRSARATPAPPLVMVGYSARLALSTTLTGLVFSGASKAPMWQLPLLVAIPFLVWSGIRLVRAHDRWVDPVRRARVTMTVAA